MDLLTRRSFIPELCSSFFSSARSTHRLSETRPHGIFGSHFYWLPGSRTSHSPHMSCLIEVLAQQRNGPSASFNQSGRTAKSRTLRKLRSSNLNAAHRYRSWIVAVTTHSLSPRPNGFVHPIRRRRLLCSIQQASAASCLVLFSLSFVRWFVRPLVIGARFAVVIQPLQAPQNTPLFLCAMTFLFFSSTLHRPQGTFLTRTFFHLERSWHLD
jgi:hypothetical protein